MTRRESLVIAAVYLAMCVVACAISVAIGWFIVRAIFGQ